MMSRSIGLRACAVLIVAASGMPATPAQTPGATQFMHGQTTFTQDGREVTWLLWQGTLRAVSEPRPVSQANFLFTPDGKPGPEEGGSLLRLSVTKNGEAYTLQSLAVENGPGGSGLSSYKDTIGKCKTTITRFDEKGVGGSITCTGAFDGGAAVTKVYFAGRP